MLKMKPAGTAAASVAASAFLGHRLPGGHLHRVPHGRVTQVIDANDYPSDRDVRNAKLTARVGQRTEGRAGDGDSRILILTSFDF